MNCRKMKALDYYVVLENVCRKHHIPIDITRYIYQYGEFLIKKKINMDSVKKEIINHYRIFNNDFLRSRQLYMFNIYPFKLPYQFDNIYDVIKESTIQWIETNNMDLKFSHNLYKHAQSGGRNNFDNVSSWLTKEQAVHRSLDAETTRNHLTNEKTAVEFNYQIAMTFVCSDSNRFNGFETSDAPNLFIYTGQGPFNEVGFVEIPLRLREQFGKYDNLRTPLPILPKLTSRSNTDLSSKPIFQSGCIIS